LFSPRGGLASGEPNRSPAASMGRLLRRPSQVLHSSVCGRSGDGGHKVKREVWTGYEEKYFPMKVVKQWNKGPERLCSLHPWKFAK